MASGKKSALLSSLAAYGDDSEQDSDPDTDEQEAHGGLVSAGYGDDDAGRAEEGDERDSGNEESDENDGISEADDSDSAEPHEDSKVFGQRKKKTLTFNLFYLLDLFLNYKRTINL
ncbi:hypothetical protein PGIGA_G00240270 [Pangasianodon gigas]|uniref:Uncharacterized protein n=1 Tax=Pangasianodon gigas TaxID=30993 RepID=A0ACC5WMZ6_PANGG|nr:hypothetical protein [Pangasianodon gigas]